MVLAYTKLSFNFCHPKIYQRQLNHDERYKKLKENCRPIKLTRSISLATIRPEDQEEIGIGWNPGTPTAQNVLEVKCPSSTNGAFVFSVECQVFHCKISKCNCTPTNKIFLQSKPVYFEAVNLEYHSHFYLNIH